MWVNVVCVVASTSASRNIPDGVGPANEAVTTAYRGRPETAPCGDTRSSQVSGNGRSASMT